MAIFSKSKGVAKSRSTDVPCPFCYTRIRPDFTAFRCTGNSPAGAQIKCEAEPDDAQIHHFNNNTPMLPVIINPSTGAPILGAGRVRCTNCHADTGNRVCPECHSRLPSGLNLSSKLYSMVGVRSSGKTVMLTAMHSELRGRLQTRFNASIDAPSSDKSLVRDLDQNARAMRNGGGQLPAQTALATSQKRMPAVYEWLYELKGKQVSTILSFQDAAGEDFISLDRIEGLRYMGAASGLIVLLDPFAFPENFGNVPAELRTQYDDMQLSPEAVLTNITEVLRSHHVLGPGQKIDVPLAVVISKIDRYFYQIPENHPLRRPSSDQPYFDMEEAQNVHDHMGALIAQWGGGGLLRKLEQNYSKFMLFGASALGAEPDYGSSEVNSRGWLPHRVTEPLLWLMAVNGFIPTGE